MIKVKKITIKEFRGIRSLALNLDNKNFAVCGPNGTGKSGIVDALEFALTGNVSRLSGEGRGEVSLKNHGPHVDSRNRPDKAYVILKIFIPSLNKEIEIDRNIADPDNPKITPSSPEILKILGQVKNHPEFVLSRRELIKYIISTPGKRSEEVQALLRLNQVDILRKSLLKIANSNKKETSILLRGKQQTKERLFLSLDISEFQPDLLLKAVNKRRLILNLDPIENLTFSTTLKDGLVTTKKSQVGNVPKKQAILDIAKLNEIINELSAKETKEQVILIIELIEKLKDEENEVENSVKHDNLLKIALELVDDKGCPVCDTPWRIDDIKKHIENKRESFKRIAEKCQVIRNKIKPILSLLDRFKIAINIAKNYGASFSPIIDVNNVNIFVAEIQMKVEKLDEFTPLANTIDVLNHFSDIPSDLIEKIKEIEAAILKIPEPTKQDAAREYLTVCQERFEVFKRASFRHKKANDRTKLAQNIYNKYSEVSTNILNNIYKEVEKHFSEFYKTLNKEDEGEFIATLIPSIGKLGFDVDFYGKGYFPPGAYHSEGHQDAMGLCLYLALMKHLLGDSFTFAVLDDVLMSVDTGHRREVCNLLKTQFPDTQFVFTTHDEVWLRYMKTVGLIKSKAFTLFSKWDVDNGPTDWPGRDMWQEFKDEAENNNIQTASSKLRNYLEYISKEICHRLRAKVEFRGDSLFQLGDLLSSATSRFKKLLNDSKSAAISWGKTDEVERIKGIEKDFIKILANSKVEEWQINPAIHYNEWVNFSKEDFLPVINAFHDLIKFFECNDCNGMLYLVPERGAKESLRCSCNSFALNFQKKK